MKKVACVIALVLLELQIVKCQMPDKFNYQGILRNSSNDLITNTNITVKIGLLEGSAIGELVYSETHSAETNNYGQFNIIIGSGESTLGSLSTLNWVNETYYLNIDLDKDGGDNFTNIGVIQLLSVPYALSAKSAQKLGKAEVYTTTSDTLFVVKDHEGNVIFAVFPDGAELIVNESIKGKVGGFAISGRSPNKEEQNDYFIVTADSTRIYINDTTVNKGKVGGFAISGRSPNKNNTNPFIRLTPNNYFIGHQSGENNETGLYNSFFGYQTGMFNQGGSKNIFIGYKTGSLNGDGNDNVFIGNSAGYNNEFGDQNIFLGHYAGFSNQTGYYNIFIGDSAGYSNNPSDATVGFNNIYIGQRSGLKNIGRNNIFMGTQTGYQSHSARDCIFIGWESGYNNQGNNNVFLGNKAGAGWSEAEIFSGSSNVFVGSGAGAFNQTGNYNVCVGADAGAELFNGSENIILGVAAGVDNRHGDANIFIGAYSGFASVNGDSSVYIGYKAGYNEDHSNRLIIENSESTYDQALIYGEFDNDILQINNRLGVGIYPSDTSDANLVVEGNIRVANGAFLDDGVTVSDFVFNTNYELPSIEQHANFMYTNKHLPKVDSKQEVNKSGIVNMSERREQILEELEIAHIYIHKLHQEISDLKKENKKFKNNLSEQSVKIADLEMKIVSMMKFME